MSELVRAKVDVLVLDSAHGHSKNVMQAAEEVKSEFGDVKRTFVPIHSVVRVDEVEKEGVNKVAPSDGSESKVTPFPMPAFGSGKDTSPSGDG